MSQNQSIVAVYGSHAEVEEAIHELRQSKFDIAKLSIVGRGYHADEKVIGYYNAGDRMKYWGTAGAYWGGIWGLLFGSAFFWMPGIGPLLVAGPVVTWIIGALEGAVTVGGLSALGAGLYSVGIPKDSILSYEAAVNTDKFLLVVHGTAEEVAQAQHILARSHPDSINIHSPLPYPEESRENFVQFIT